MRFRCWLCILAFVASGFASEAPEKQSKASSFSIVFADGVAKYAHLRQELEGSVRAQRSTNQSEEITDRQDQLTGVIANARRDARQGEIFTNDVAKEFREIIRKAFRERGGRAMRKTIEERDPIQPVVLKVNAVYPDDLPRTTMSPTLLRRLPVLPKELAYRIIGRALVLQDTKTNLIVDFIPNAIP
jgi:hypothetical protein